MNKTLDPRTTRYLIGGFYPDFRFFSIAPNAAFVALRGEGPVEGVDNPKRVWHRFPGKGKNPNLFGANNQIVASLVTTVAYQVKP